LYFYTLPQDSKNKKRRFTKLILVLLAVALIFIIGMRLGTYYENIPADKAEVEKLAAQVYGTKNTELIEEFKGFEKLHPAPSEKQVDAFRDYFKERKDIPVQAKSLPESQTKDTTEGVTIDSPGVDHQSLAVSATSLKIGQFVMDANSCIYAVQNTHNVMTVVPALNPNGQQYCPPKAQ
jgi:hypothetical protein